MFDDKYLIPRAKLTHPHWVLYRDETDFIGRIGTGPTKDETKPYKPWSDPTVPDASRLNIFTGGGDANKTVSYWILGEGLLPITDQRVKDFYLGNDAWRAYEAMLQHRFVFHRGVPWCFRIEILSKDAPVANFANANESEFSIPHPLKLNVSTESVCLLPQYASGKNEVVGITYGNFVRNIPKVTAIPDKLEVIQGIIANPNFTDEDKWSAICVICTQPINVPDPLKPLGEKAQEQELSPQKNEDPKQLFGLRFY